MIDEARRANLGSIVARALGAVVDRPSTWPLALAGFLLRGGWLVVLAPIVVLPTAVGLANVIAPLLEDVAFGRRTGELLILIGLSLIGVVAWLIGGGVIAAVAEIEGVRRIAADVAGRRSPGIEGDRAWTAAWRIVALRLVAHVPFAVVLIWGAARLAAVGYAELTVPSDVTIPAPWRIAIGAPDAIVGITLSWLFGETIGAIGARRVTLHGDGVRTALRASVVGYLRSPHRPTVLAVLSLIAGAAVLAVSALAASAALEPLRAGLAVGDASPVTAILLVAFVGLFAAGLVLIGLTSAWRGAIWTVEAVLGAPRTFGGVEGTQSGD